MNKCRKLAAVAVMTLFACVAIHTPAGALSVEVSAKAHNVAAVFSAEQWALFAGLALLLAVLALAVCWYFSRRFTRPMESLLESIRRMQQGDFSHRFSTNGNSKLSIVGNAFNQLMDQVMADNRRLTADEERYRMVIQLSDNVVFEYGLADKQIYCSANWQEKFGYPPVTSGGTDDWIKTVYPDDVEKLQNAVQRLIKTGDDLSEEVRLCKMEGDSPAYLWCTVRASVVRDCDGTASKIIGNVSDIDSQKKETETLRARAQRDLLTGLYNKVTTESIISSILEREPQGVHALFIVDIDDFKSINDNLGHLFGDSVLEDLAQRIRNLFRSTDVAGRVGGDEFVVFLRNVGSCEKAEEKSQQLLNAFCRTYGGGLSCYEVTGSVGGAVSPDDGTSFNDLFQAADNALYAAKSQGKNRCLFFSEQVKEEYYLKTLERTQAEDRSRTPKMMRSNLTGYIFEILYEAQDVKAAVQLILEMVGKHYRVGRAYVFENSWDNRYCCNTFEWCDEGIEPQKEQLSHIPYTQLGDYASYFDKDGVFYCEDVGNLSENLAKTLQSLGVHSVLQCAIRKGGVFRGFVGFDEFGEQRLWTKDEITTLAFVAKILSVFLVKLQEQNEKERSYHIATSVVDTQRARVYVVEPNTYRLLYCNRSAREAAFSLPVTEEHSEGKHLVCYQSLMGKERPCAGCPVKKCSELQKDAGGKVYNAHRDVWSKAAATPMEWEEGARACLMVCDDAPGAEELAQGENSEKEAQILGARQHR